MTSNTMSEQVSVPKYMQALHLPSSFTNQPTPGGPSSLKYETERPVPKPGTNQYLIKVHTVCVSVDELEQTRTSSSTFGSNNVRDSGMVLERPTADGIDRIHGLIPGRELCGEVISTPREDHYTGQGPAFKVGDEVIGVLGNVEGRDGAAADYTLATENELAYKPSNLSAAEAVTIPHAALIAWQGLFGYATLDPDDGPCNKPADGPLRVLVTNAAQSDVGRYVMLLLKCQALFPHHVLGLMGGGLGEAERSVWVCATGAKDEHEYLLKELGADEVTASTDIASAFREKGWKPVDIVFDCVGAGGALFREAHSPIVVKDHGHVLTPRRPPSAHFDKPSERDERTEIMTRNLTSEVIDVKPNKTQLAKIVQLIEKGVLKPDVSYQVEDLLNGQLALVYAEKAGEQKVVLRVDPAGSQF